MAAVDVHQVAGELRVLAQVFRHCSRSQHDSVRLP
jgi:hypothetical protein